MSIDLENLSKEEATADAPTMIVLPVGYMGPNGVLYNRVNIVETGGEEEDLLGKKSDGAPMRSRIEQVIMNCVREVLPAADEPKDDEKPRPTLTTKKDLLTFVQELPASDRLFLLVELHKLAPGLIWKFKTKCPDKDCDTPNLKVFDLNLLKTEKPEGFNPRQRTYSVSLPKSGKTATMKLHLGKDEGTYDDLVETLDDKFTAFLFVRTMDVGGLPPKYDDIKRLKTTDRHAMRVAIKKNEPVFERTIDIKCGGCGAVYEYDLPIGSFDFFFPSET